MTYKNLEDALVDLKAVDRGSYFLCECPDCKKNEAFMYKNNTNVIRCNRENECGEKTIVKYEEKKSSKELKLLQMKKEYPTLSEEQVETMNWLVDVMDHVERYDKSFSSGVLDESFRGLSRGTTKKFVLDLGNQDMVSSLLKKIEPLIGKDYSNSDFMTCRNLIMPIYGKDGLVDRIVLRSSLNPDISPKEVQLITNRTREARDFFVSVPKSANTIIVGEGLMDVLSFREIDPTVGVIGLTGSTKTRQMLQAMEKRKEILKEKNIIVAMDNDKAGMKAKEKIVDALKQNRIGKSVSVFFYGEKAEKKSISDPNDYLIHDKVGFTKKFQALVSKDVSKEGNTKKRSVAMER